MRRAALVYVLAVLAPSLVLAWLAFRSLRDQQFVIERQRSLLYQGVTDSVARDIANHLLERQREFSLKVEELLAGKKPLEASATFDQRLRQAWPLADVGFCVTLSGNFLSPSPASSPAASVFCADNAAFLGNRESAEVYWNTAAKMGGFQNLGQSGGVQTALQKPDAQSQAVTNQPSQENLVAAKMKGRAVNPVQQIPVAPNAQIDLPAEVNYSKIAPAEAEFRQLVGNDMDGTLARFLQNRLRVMFWHRPPSDPQLVFGAQLELNRVITGLRSLVRADLAIADQICLVLLDERARPVVATRENFQADWKRPFVAAEIGDALPHWEVAAYFVNPASLQQTARTVKLTLGLLIATLVVAVAAGGWLIFANLNRQLTLARQKTDFVSNVSHELKTPLTSIRMFSELLSQGRVVEPEKQKSYLNIITAEAARLTRLINNVLDFSRMERGEKKYNLQDCDLADIARATADALRPHLENTGFRLECSLPASPLPVRVDSDALAQVIMNLLSNAEKYSDGQKTIELRVNRYDGPIPYAEVSVLDRGMGVPGGSGEKIFEKFYRAHDSLSSGIQGSGLGLTLARQIARAHGGDVTYEPREGGGSCFSLRLPLKTV